MFSSTNGVEVAIVAFLTVYITSGVTGDSVIVLVTSGGVLNVVVAMLEFSIVTSSPRMIFVPVLLLVVFSITLTVAVATVVFPAVYVTSAVTTDSVVTSPGTPCDAVFVSVL